MISENEERQLAASGLARSADAHDRGDFHVIELEFDEFERHLSPDAAAISDDVLLAFSFWDAWVDSSNHSWKFYEPLHQSDWPLLARELASYLSGSSTILNPIMLEKFAPEPVRQPWYSRLRKWFVRIAG